MINERREAQNEMEVVMIEQLVPQDHLLRKIDKYIDNNMLSHNFSDFNTFPQFYFLFFIFFIYNPNASVFVWFPLYFPIVFTYPHFSSAHTSLFPFSNM